MRIDFLSDIHLEFFDDPNGLTLDDTCRYWFRKFAGIRGSVLLIAGDITSSYQRDRTYVDRFFEMVCERYRQVYAVLGNHDYWNKRIPVTEMKAHYEKQWPCVRFLENETVLLRPGLRLFGATWWSFVPPKLRDFAKSEFNDYRKARMKGGSLSPAFTSELHERSKIALAQAVAAHPNDDFIVLSHHAPSMTATKFFQPLFSNLYCSDDDAFLGEHPQIKVWIHGHLHGKMSYGVAYARVYTNPHGYIPDERCIEDDGTSDFEIRSFRI